MSSFSSIGVYQRKGGKNYWSNILRRISFSHIADLINSKSSYIKYKSYEWDSVNKKILETKDSFILEMIPPTLFSLDSRLIPFEDSNKPAELSGLIIGYQLSEQDTYSDFYRYDGGYVPLFRDVLNFRNVKNDTLNIFERNSAFSVKLVEKDLSDETYKIGSIMKIKVSEAIIPTLVRGKKYVFDISDSSNTNQTIVFSTDNTNSSDTVFMDGYDILGTPGNSGAKITFTVPYNCPDTLILKSLDEKFSGMIINIIDPIIFKNISFGYDKDNFGKIKNLNFYKYSKSSPFRISGNSAFKPLYPLINETPIDTRDLSVFASSWSPGFFREYKSSTAFTEIPGIRSMKEIKSFMGSKCMITPDEIVSQIQNKYPTSISDVFNIDYTLYPKYEILWEETSTQINALILLDRIIINHFDQNGAGEIFNKYLLSDFGIGAADSLLDDIDGYIIDNILKIYESKNLKSYLKRTTIKPTEDLPALKTDMYDYIKLVNGYNYTKDSKFIKRNELVYEYSITKDPGFDYSISFSFELGKI